MVYSKRVYKKRRYTGRRMKSGGMGQLAKKRAVLNVVSSLLGLSKRGRTSKGRKTTRRKQYNKKGY